MKYITIVLLLGIAFILWEFRDVEFVKDSSCSNINFIEVPIKSIKIYEEQTIDQHSMIQLSAKFEYEYNGQIKTSDRIACDGYFVPISQKDKSKEELKRMTKALYSVSNQQAVLFK